jgi:MFS family permease
VGLIYVIGSIGSILALLIAPRIWRKAGGYKFLLSIILLTALSLFALSIVENIFTAVIIFVLFFSLNTLLIFSLDEILKIFSKDSSTGKIRGIYIAVCNLAWILAQLTSGAVLGAFTFRMIYVLSFGVMILFFLISYLGLRNLGDPVYDKTKTKKYIIEFFKNKNLFRVFGMTLLLQFFYCLMVIYTPIYLALHLGFSWREIGIIFAIMLLPFTIIPFYVGKYSDKIGERRMLMFGFFVASVATFSLFFIHQHTIWVWALALFITRIGAAIIEVMSDAYFFKHIKSENDEFVGVYRSSAPVGYVIGPLVAFIIFSFVPSFNFIYLALGAIMLFGVYLSSTIRKEDI